MGSAVSKPEVDVPDLVPTTTMEIDAADVSYPRIKIAHPTQGFVIDGKVPPFAVYSELNRDSEKTVLFRPGTDDDPIRIHVLALRKGKSATVDPATGRVVERNTPGAEFRSWAFNDERGPSPQDRGVDTTFNYVLFCPQLDAADQPHRLLLTRSSTPTARTLNTYLQLAERSGKPAYTLAFDLYSEKREKDSPDGQTFRFGVFKVTQVLPDTDDIAAASALTALINAAPPAAETKALEATDDAPAI